MIKSPEFYSTIATAGGSVSAADKIMADVKAKVQANKAKVPGEDTTTTSGGAAAPIEPLFTHTDSVTSGKVSLRSLVPSWDKRRKIPDVMVTVCDISLFDESQKARIPEVNPHYMPNQEALSQLAYAIENTTMPSLLTGKPSVGKSSLVEYYCAITGRPFYRFNYNGTMDASSLLGTQSASGGSTHWLSLIHI